MILVQVNGYFVCPSSPDSELAPEVIDYTVVVLNEVGSKK